MNDTSLKILRKTASEVLAYAVYDLFPGVSLDGGEISDIGFSYDFITDHPLTPEVMPLIEERMRAIIKEGLEITVMEMIPVNAMEFFKHHKLHHLRERLEDSEDQLVQILKIDKFYDICESPCGDTTQEAGVFKLLSLKSLGEGKTRIGGTAFSDKQLLKDFLKRLDRAKGLDFATLGSELQLCLYSEKGTIWLPKGVALREMLLKFFREEYRKLGFEEIFSKRDFAAFPVLFQAKPYLQKDLPQRYIQTSSEVPIWQVFCQEEQMHQEIISSLQFFDKMVNIFGFRTHYVLCPTRAKSGGGLKNWGKNVDILVQALKSCGFNYETDQQKESPLGPRIEVCITDAIGRRWAGPFLGVDLLHPDRLNLAYKSAEGSLRIVGSLFGSTFESLERLIALLVENYAGVFPFWLAPEQVRIVPLAESNFAYAYGIEKQLIDAGIRVRTDARQGALGEKIHAAINEKMPYIVIVGEKEEKSGTISVRLPGQKENRSGIRIEDFLGQLRNELCK